MKKRKQEAYMVNAYKIIGTYNAKLKCCQNKKKMQSWNKADYSSSSRCLEMKCSKFWLNSMTYENRNLELTIVLQQQHRFACHR